MNDFTLSSPDGTTNRFQEFRAIIERFYRWRWNQECPWDGSEAKQLSSFLKASPTVDVKDFKLWLKRYGESEDIKPGERPRCFLPKIHNYSVVPLDRYGRSAGATKTKPSWQQVESQSDKEFRENAVLRARALKERGAADAK